MDSGFLEKEYFELHNLTDYEVHILLNPKF